MSPLLRSLAIGAAASSGGSSMALPMDIVRRIVADEVSTMSKAEYLQDIRQGFPVRYGCVAAVTIVLWDWVTNLSDEVEFIWLRASGMSGRPLYCFIRYAGFAYQVYDLISQFGVWESVAYCKVYYAFLPIGTLAFLYAADVLLAYRALCLWRMNRTLVIFNVVVFLISVIASTVFAAFSISQYNIVPTPRFLTGCWVSIPDYNFVAPVPGLLFEFWVFALVLFRAISFSKKDGLKISKLGVVQMLFKDSMWWFFMITVLLVVNTLFLAVAPTNLSLFFIPLFRTFVIVFGCNLVLRMRRAAAGNSRLPTPIEMATWQHEHHQHQNRNAPAEQQRHTRTSSNNTNSRTKFRIPCPYCRKLVRLGSKKLGWHCRDDENDNDRNNSNSSNDAPGGSRSISTTEAQRIERTLDIAQKMGLPPALHQDLMMWYDPLTTLNQNTTTVLELTSVSGPAHEQGGGGVTSTSEVDGTVTATSDERSLKKEVFLKSPRTRVVGLAPAGHRHAKSSLSGGSCWDYPDHRTSSSPTDVRSAGLGSGKGDYDEDEEDGRVEFNVRYVLGEEDEEEEDGDVGVSSARGQGAGRWVDVEGVDRTRPPRQG
ncbi:hypothetical protein FRC04_010570 [Tulasnella sp. 424]|nr:hypothetical protein FRC04_010570 [Tulasnella sp. 424]